MSSPITANRCAPLNGTLRITFREGCAQMPTDVIEHFIARYRKEYDFFDLSSRLAAQILGGRLRAAGIRSMVTSRAKAVDRLEAKVRERAPRKDYASAEEIFADIVDLAGVR